MITAPSTMAAAAKTSAPEPDTLALFTAAIAGLGLVQRRAGGR